MFGVGLCFELGAFGFGLGAVVLWFWVLFGWVVYGCSCCFVCYGWWL